MDYISLTLPLSKEVLADLHAGDACLLTGDMYTLRDAGHARLLDEMHAGADGSAGAHAGAAGSADVHADGSAADAETSQLELPYGLSGQTIFYAGPTPATDTQVFGAVGPTTASRMDFAAPELYRAGICATIGKGSRSREVHEACVETGSVYFVATGGAAAYLAQCVDSAQVIAYEDLGTEALRKIHVTDFPVFVGIDTKGIDIYDL